MLKQIAQWKNWLYHSVVPGHIQGYTDYIQYLNTFEQTAPEDHRFLQELFLQFFWKYYQHQPTYALSAPPHVLECALRAMLDCSPQDKTFLTNQNLLQLLKQQPTLHPFNCFLLGLLILKNPAVSVQDQNLAKSFLTDYLYMNFANVPQAVTIMLRYLPSFWIAIHEWLQPQQQEPQAMQQQHIEIAQPTLALQGIPMSQQQNLEVTTEPTVNLIQQQATPEKSPAVKKKQKKASKKVTSIQPDLAKQALILPTPKIAQAEKAAAKMLKNDKRLQKAAENKEKQKKEAEAKKNVQTIVEQAPVAITTTTIESNKPQQKKLTQHSHTQQSDSLPAQTLSTHTQTKAPDVLPVDTQSVDIELQTIIPTIIPNTPKPMNSLAKILLSYSIKDLTSQAQREQIYQRLAENFNAQLPYRDNTLKSCSLLGHPDNNACLITEQQAALHDLENGPKEGEQHTKSIIAQAMLNTFYDHCIEQYTLAAPVHTYKGAGSQISDIHNKLLEDLNKSTAFWNMKQRAIKTGKKDIFFPQLKQKYAIDNLEKSQKAWLQYQVEKSLGQQDLADNVQRMISSALFNPNTQPIVRELVKPLPAIPISPNNLPINQMAFNGVEEHLQAEVSGTVKHLIAPQLGLHVNNNEATADTHNNNVRKIKKNHKKK